MPELELIKLARQITSVWSLLALTALILYLISGKVLEGISREGNVPFAFRKVVLNKVFWFGIIIVGAALVIKVLPLFAFQDTPVHGVVLRKGAQTTVPTAQVSIDGLAGLSANSDSNGNFQISVPAARRQVEYIVRAQLAGEAGSAKLTDAAAPNTSLAIELPALGENSPENLPRGAGPVDKLALVERARNQKKNAGPGWHKEWRGNDPDTAVAHKTGRANATRWTTNSTDDQGALLYGPYSELGGGAGAYQAFWDLSLNEKCSSDDEILSFDVFDSERTILGTLSVKPSDWGGRVSEFKQFRVEFSKKPSDVTYKYEFRVFWRGHCGVTLKRFGVERIR
jgi:hypothetical protein